MNLKKGLIHIDYVLAIGIFFVTFAFVISYTTDYYIVVKDLGDVAEKRSDAFNLFVISERSTIALNNPEILADATTVLLMHFNGDTIDYSGINPNVISSGPDCSTNVEGLLGTGCNFDGSNDYISTTTNQFSNLTATIETWIKFDTISSSDDYTLISVPSEIGLNDNLITLWHFDRNDSSANGIIDHSGSSNHGSHLNSPMFITEGRFGAAYYYDGSGDDTIRKMGAYDFRGIDFTWEAWIKPDSGSSGRILSNYAEITFDTVGAYLDLGTIDGKTLTWATCGGLTANVWQHIVLTFNDGTGAIGLYLDGEICDSDTGINSIDRSFGSMYVGSGDADWNWNYEGFIDEVAIYDDRELTPEEVRDHYLGGLSLHKMNDDLRFVAGNTTIIYNASNLNGWAHIVGTYNSTKAILYINGTEVDYSAKDTIRVFGTNIFIGGSNTSLSLDGTLDEVAIFNKMLSEGTIKNHALGSIQRIDLHSDAYRFYIKVNNSLQYQFNQSANQSNIENEIVSFNISEIIEDADEFSVRIYDNGTLIPYNIVNENVTFLANVSINQTKWYTIYFDDDSTFVDSTVSISGVNNLTEIITPYEIIDILQYDRILLINKTNHDFIKNATNLESNFRFEIVDTNSNVTFYEFGKNPPRTVNVIALEKFTLFQNETGGIKEGKIIFKVW